MITTTNNKYTSACTFRIVSNESTQKGISTNRTVLESLNGGDFFVYVVWKYNCDLYLDKWSGQNSMMVK